MPRKRAQGKIEHAIDHISYFNRDEIRFITLEHFNELIQCSYENVTELIFDPPAMDEELKLRHSITRSAYDLSPIIVVDAIPDGKLTVYLDAITYDDTKELLVTID